MIRTEQTGAKRLEVFMIEKTPSDDGTLVELTFVVPRSRTTTDVFVVGDFNGWAQSATPLQHRGDQQVATVRVAPGRRYVFRYWSGGDWFNDEAADAYEPNEFGGHNCVVDLDQWRDQKDEWRVGAS